MLSLPAGAKSTRAGVRYLFVGQLFEQRPTYRLLGFLLFLQLGIGAAAAAARQALVALGLASSVQKAPGHLQQGGLQHAAVLHVRLPHMSGCA